MNFLGNTNELILVEKGIKHLKRNHPVNIMLTPEFYTLKRETLPVKYAYQAKRIASSLFEGLLEAEGTYQYFVYKEEEEWLFIAYDLDEIQQFLVSVGLEIEQVKKIFFAQQAAKSFTAPILLGKSNALVNLDGTIVLVPQMALSEGKQSLLKVNNSFTPKKGIIPKGAKSALLSQQQALTLSAVFLLFSVMFIVEGWRYDGDSEAQKLELRTLFDAYPSLESSYTRESILSKYRTIDTLERKKRDVIKILSQMIFKGATLTSIVMDDQKFQTEFTYENQDIMKKLKELAQKEKFNTTEVSNKKVLKIEGAL